MSTQCLSNNCCSETVFRVTRNGLEVGCPFRPLQTVFLTPSVYVPSINIPNDIVPTKVATSVYRSVPNVKPQCQYLSWQQITPPGRDLLGLSWLIVDDTLAQDPREVIQFLTNQLSYKIDWKILSGADSDITFVPVQAGAREAFKAPDICGNRICFTGTSGSFTVPGQYGQFVISAPSLSVILELQVTGFIDNPYIYGVNGNAPTEFTVNSQCGKTVSYTNVITDPTTVTVTRTIAPTFASLAALTTRLYHRRAFLPCFASAQPSQARCFPSTTQMVAPQSGCFPPVSQVITQGPVPGTLNIVRAQSKFYLSGQRYNTLNFIIIYAETSNVDLNLQRSNGASYAIPSILPIIIPDGNKQIITTTTGLLNQSNRLVLANGTTYRFTFEVGTNVFTSSSIWGLSPSYNDYLVYHQLILPNVPPLPFTGTPFVIVPPNNMLNFNLTINNVSQGMPLQYIEGSSPDPAFSNNTNVQMSLLYDGVQGVGEDAKTIFRLDGPLGARYTYIVSLPGSSDTSTVLSLNLNSPTWGHSPPPVIYVGGANDLEINFTVEQYTI